MRAGAAGCLTARPVEDALCVVVDDPLLALGRLARELVDRGVAWRASGRRDHRFTGQDLDQGPAGPDSGDGRPDRGAAGQPEQRARRTADRQPDRSADPVPDRGDGRPRHRAHRVPVRRSPRPGRSRAQRRPRPCGRVRWPAAIAQAKGELVDALPADGIAVLNADDPLVWAMRSRTSARRAGLLRPRRPGVPGVWASDPVTGANGCYSFALHARPETGPEAQVEVELQVTGRHQVGNATAAATAALALGLDLEAVGSALSAAGSRSRWRMELHQRADGVTVINDSYNANPDSMRAAVETSGRIRRPREPAGPGPSSATCSSSVTPPKPSTRRSVGSSPSGASTTWWRSASTPERLADGAESGTPARFGPGLRHQGRRRGRGDRRSRPRRRRPGQGLPWPSLEHRGRRHPCCRPAPARPEAAVQ